MSGNDSFFPPEWVEQDAVVLIWPTKDMDWAYILDDIEQCYVQIIKTIAKFEPVVVLSTIDPNYILEKNGEVPNLHIFPIDHANDTWARDVLPLSVVLHGKRTILDFGFNGWGLKFAANHDNRITRYLYEHQFFSPQVEYSNNLDFILEGGAVEVNGEGVMLTTVPVLQEANRNPFMELREQERMLSDQLPVSEIHTLDVESFEGDDTDGHIDTLARFINPATIAYQEGHADLAPALFELRSKASGRVNLIALPSIQPIKDPIDGSILPATYANFLFVNGGIIVPQYNVDTDNEALERLRNFFSDKELKVVGVDCSTLIRQHGSLHCISMQFPKGFLNPQIFKKTVCK